MTSRRYVNHLSVGGGNLLTGIIMTLRRTRSCVTCRQSVVERSADPTRERVLILSDSRAVLDVIESVWRTGDTTICKSMDRGAMIEAVCEARRLMQRVVFAWCPGHRGIVPNEYADIHTLTRPLMTRHHQTHCWSGTHSGLPVRDGERIRVRHLGTC